MLPWGAQTPFEMLSSVLSFQAYASQQQAAAQGLGISAQHGLGISPQQAAAAALAAAAAAAPGTGKAAAALSCPAGAPCCFAACL